MNKKQRALYIILWSILILEWIALLLLIYFSRLPYFISLFVSFIQVFSPWFIAINLAFLFYTLFTKGLEFTWVFWKDYLQELARFFVRSFAATLLAIVISATLGTALGLSADFVTRLPTWEKMRQWASDYFY